MFGYDFGFRVKTYGFSSSVHGDFFVYWDDLISFDSVDHGENKLAKVVFIKKNHATNTLFIPWIEKPLVPGTSAPVPASDSAQ